jgi:hypothetical protein
VKAAQAELDRRVPSSSFRIARGAASNGSRLRLSGI